MTKYVAGFMFQHEKVGLVIKNRPHWQKGKMNAIGGHIEENESPVEAMRREFVEETGYPDEVEWVPFVVLSGEKFEVHFFYTWGDLEKLQTTTDEEIIVVDTCKVNSVNSIANLEWLIPMAKSMRGSVYHVQEKE